MKRNNNKGFTLAELLIVVAVIAVLVAVAIPTFGSQLEKSRQAVDLSNLRGAYAAAKLMILNQDDEGNFLKEGKSSKADIYAWYDPDSGEFKTATAETTVTAAGEAYKVGKATTASVIVSTTGLPETIFYDDGVLKAGTNGKTSAGTKNTGIVVKFMYDEFTNTFSVPTATFNDKAQVGTLGTVTAPAAEIEVNATGASIAPTITDGNVKDLHGDAPTGTKTYTYTAMSPLPSGATIDGNMVKGTITGKATVSIMVKEELTGATAVYKVALKPEA